MKTLDYIFLTVLIIGGFNWGLIGLFNFNLVSMLFGEGTFLTNLVYILVGVSSLYSIMYYSYFARREEIDY